MIRQLSVFGKRLTSVNFKPNVVRIPTATPMMRLPKNTSKNIPIASKKVKTVSEAACFPDSTSGTYFWAVSKSTMAMASFRIDSPKMTV